MRNRHQSLGTLASLTVVLTVSGCGPVHRAPGRGGRPVPESLLIEVVQRSPWSGETRFVVTSGVDSETVRVQVEGRVRKGRHLNEQSASRLRALAERYLLEMESSDDGCEDCTEYWVTVRLDTRVNFAMIRQLETRDVPGLEELLSILGVR